MLFLIYIKNCKKTILFYHYGHRYFSRMHKEKGSGRALGLDPFFRDRLCFFVFFYFLLPFYLRILILYTTDFNPRINKDIIIIIITIIIWVHEQLKHDCVISENRTEKLGKRKSWKFSTFMAGFLSWNINSQSDFVLTSTTFFNIASYNEMYPGFSDCTIWNFLFQIQFYQPDGSPQQLPHQ